MCLSLVLCPSKNAALNADKSLTINDFSLRFHSSINSVVHFYPPQYTNVPNGFLHPNYWAAIEAAPCEGVRFAYLTIEKQGQTVGFMAAQIRRFEAAKSLNYGGSRAEKWLIQARELLAKALSFNTLIVGNLLHTGEHGFWFDPSLTLATKERLFTEGVFFLKKNLAQNGIRTQAVMVKEFYQASMNHQTARALLNKRFHEYQVEPSFVFECREDWNDFDDYLNALATKYRTRAKRAFKKLGNEVEKRSLSLTEIRTQQLAINRLFEYTRTGSGFNLVDTPPQYFAQLKADLGEKFQLYTYEKDNETIGFFSTIDNGAELEAHFVGYNPDFNGEHQTYLNMLFDMVRLAIAGKHKRLVLSRTAHEIKSSVGAKAEDMSLFFRHDNPILNSFFPTILRSLSPRETWQPRQPFKENTPVLEVA